MALDEILRNFPIKWLGVVVRHTLFPLGLSLRKPNDSLGHRVAALMIRPGEARDRLTAGVYINDDPDDITGCLEDALGKVIKAEPIERRLRREAVFQDGLEDYFEWIERLQGSGQLSADEAITLAQARRATMRVVRVDDFTPEELKIGRGDCDNSSAAENEAAATAADKKSSVKKASKKKASKKKASTKK